MNRRHFAATATAAPAEAAPAAGGAAGREALRRQMLGVLAADLDDRATAAVEVPRILDVCFTWEPPTVEPERMDFLLAYSFGNRAPAGGGDPAKVLYEPGPVNEALADTVARIHRRRPVPVYAQWEIAHFLTGKHGLTDVTAINPVIAADGTITYLSTYGVAAQVAASRKGLPGGIGTAGVVGFRDHVKRCVLTTRLAGIAAAGAPAGQRMPGDYDPQSGQAWTRSRAVYLVHDMGAQLQMLEQELLA
ncbi:hypothetical protein [Kitasatospora viridis]|uniref:Uncharacterized protein n=1 Tax=Kitasatospora viridis TaxID=281105 RepID=A0A561S9E6_9ACTN|nr:hypothetical protein [Kitasatospora viridis]TWF71499.1 hypothetical protein FHX73_19129 [Kitasatospora viridis]